MNFVSVKETILLRSQPVDGSPPVKLAGGFSVRVYPEDILVNVEDGPGAWSAVTIDSGGGTGPSGFVKTAYLVTKTIAPPKDVSLDEFANLCAVASRAE
jgi:hypothetical protein